MPHSQNGYPANDRSLVASYTIPGGFEKVAVRRGDVSKVLMDLLGFIRKEVFAIEHGSLDEWGYAERPIRGSTTTLSNHASGTAIDVDARLHPLGKSGTWASADVRLIEARLKLYGGCVRWGRNYHGRKDEMHFEIVGSPALVAKIADKIQGGRLGNGAYSYLVGKARFRSTTPPTPSKHKVIHNPYTEPKTTVKRNDKQKSPFVAVKWVQWGVGFSSQDGMFGPKTEAAVKSFQRAHHLTSDGVVGEKTKAVLRKVTR